MCSTLELPELIETEAQLDACLSTPTKPLIELMRRLTGDLVVLGIGGKMGVTLGIAAVRAIEVAGISKQVFGVSRFSDIETRTQLEDAGVQTIRCDLLDRQEVAALPSVRNVIYMVGRKFGTQGQEALTWATNVAIPDHVGYHFQDSRIVVFSTGCVYPLVSASAGGCSEEVAPDPLGEYAQSCLGRERMFSYWSEIHGTPICLLRLNYAVDLRYGLLHDIGVRVYRSQPVDLTVSHFNVIWQADANGQALRCLEHCDNPPKILNVTGPETVSVRFVAETFAQLFGTEPRFTGDSDGSRMYLSNAAKAAALFGYPSVSLLKLLKWQAAWIQSGGRSLDKPTHYEVVDGRF